MHGGAEGVLAASWFAQGLGTHREAEFIKRYRARGRGADSTLAHAVVGYTAARVLFDAIEGAGTFEREAINSERANTDGEYPAGRVRFDTSHACALPAVMTLGGDDL